MSTKNSSHVHSGQDSTESRRTFVRSVAAGTVGAGLSLGFNAASYAKIKDANDRVRVAVVGLRGMGWGHVNGYAGLENVEVAALCDVDENISAKRVKEMEEMGLPRPATYYDLRRVLDDPTIDAISVATPNHWHALAGFWAVQAGKHATLEKPGTHNYFEGQQLIKAAKRYDRLIQHHAERRTFKGYKAAMKFLHEGGLGEVYLAKGMCYKWRNTIKRKGPEPVPAGVHYDLWLGPAPKREFTRNRFHYNWHWHWDYGNGDIGNQGAHQVDIARWGLGVTLPTKISSMGGHFMFDDDQETPNTQMSLFEFPSATRGRRQEEDHAVRGPPLGYQSRRRTGERGRQQHRQPLLRLRGLHGDRWRGQLADVYGKGTGTGSFGQRRRQHVPQFRGGHPRQ